LETEKSRNRLQATKGAIENGRPWVPIPFLLAPPEHAKRNNAPAVYHAALPAPKCPIRPTVFQELIVVNYLKILALFVVAYLLNAVAPHIIERLMHLGGAETAVALSLWCLGLFLVFGWVCSLLAEGTVFPSFTLQLLVGIVLHDALAPLASETTLAVVTCTALAAVILKGGGDELDRRQFAKIAFPTIMIALVGYLITFLVMFAALAAIGLDAKTSALLAAILGSTDPAALIPTLRRIAFKDEFKHLTSISVAESALNDAVGAIFVGALAAMILAGTSVETPSDLVSGLVSQENLLHLGQQFLFGTVAGVAGWGAMFLYERYKPEAELETSYDFAVVLAIPLLSFLLAQAIHGNGFLAAFLAGLLGNYGPNDARFHRTLHVMEVKVESIAKPVIFMMVGPFVALGDLWDTALLGLAVSLVFILVARPVAVLLSMLPTGLAMKDKLFLCIVRETGVIPVVLAVLTVATFPDLNQLLPLTAWVVVWTLTLLPALTPWWSRKLGLTA
jgi:NhaP-type Na+/H+ or K+/H+ antiporter